MKKVLLFLNGKKTAIGGIASQTIAFLTIKEVIDSDTATYLLSISGIILGWGLTHKTQKYYTEKNKNVVGNE